jgi:two-component system, chemotaxis family, protein-glutamate methylesterase/glutaminase
LAKQAATGVLSGEPASLSSTARGGSDSIAILTDDVHQVCELLRPNRLDERHIIVRDIIAIGGSLGGLDALCALVRPLPHDFPAVLLAVLHTLPSSPRLLAELVGRSTVLAVAYGGDGDVLQNGRLLIAPPDLHMTVRLSGHIGLDCGPEVLFVRPAVDKLFASVTRSFGPRAIGIVLSGGLQDGTAGLRAIKAAGGLGIVQDPRDARNPEMPVNAIEGGHPNYITRLNEIAPLLMKLVCG